MYRLATAVLGLALLAGACSTQSEEQEGRTFFDSLDLSTPDATVETFVGAFERDDFMTVWLALDWHSQQAINNSFDLLQYSHLVDTSKLPSPGSTITEPIADLVGRGNLDRWRIFDNLMLVADQYDAFLIDIGELKSARPIDSAEDGTASIAVVFQGSDEEVIFNLVRGEQDRWFVQQVVALGGDIERIPWAAAPRQY